MTAPQQELGERARLIAEIDKALLEVEAATERQWDKQPAFRMSIPARPDHDSDLLIHGALHAARTYLVALTPPPSHDQEKAADTRMDTKAGPVDSLTAPTNEPARQETWMRLAAEEIRKEVLRGSSGDRPSAARIARTIAAHAADGATLERARDYRLSQAVFRLSDWFKARGERPDAFMAVLGELVIDADQRLTDADIRRTQELAAKHGWPGASDGLPAVSSAPLSDAQPVGGRVENRQIIESNSSSPAQDGIETLIDMWTRASAGGHEAANALADLGDAKSAMYEHGKADARGWCAESLAVLRPPVRPTEQSK